MIRRLLIAAAAISLLFFVLIGTCWTICRVRPTEVAFARGGYFWDLTFSPDYFTVTRIDGWPIDEPAIWGRGGTILVHMMMPFLSQHDAPLDMAFMWEGQASVENTHVYTIDPWGNPAKPPAPYLFIGLRVKAMAALAGVLPGLWLAIWFKRRTKLTQRGFDVQQTRNENAAGGNGA